MNIYIINQNEHLGPYSHEDIFSFAKSGKIKSDTLLWVKNDNLKITYVEFKKLEESKINKPKVRKESNIDLVKALPELPKTKSKYYDTFKYLLIVSIILFVIYLLLPSSLNKPDSMTDKTFKSIRSFVIKKNSKTSFKFSVSKDLSQLWITPVNVKDQTFTQFEFESIPNKILSNKRVKFNYAYNATENQIKAANKLEFLSGFKLAEGYYRVNIKTKKLRVTQTVLLSQRSERMFLDTLKRYTEVREQDQQAFLKEIVQKYSTLVSISNEIIQKINLKKIDSIDAFKKLYEQKYGSLFTSFIITNEDDFKILLGQKFSNVDQVYRKYFALSNDAREFGKISMDSINNDRSLNYLKRQLEQYSSRLSSQVED